MINPQVLTFLALYHCVPSAQVVVASDLAIPGYYKAGVVVVRALNDEVLVHELYHACQEQARGPARGPSEHDLRETEAMWIQKLWTESNR